MAQDTNATAEVIADALRQAFPEPAPAPFGAIARIEGVEADTRLQADDMLVFANQLLKDGVDRDQIVQALKENGYALANPDTRPTEVKRFDEFFPPVKSVDDYQIEYRGRVEGSVDQMIAMDAEVKGWLGAMQFPANIGAQVFEVAVDAMNRVENMSESEVNEWGRKQNEILLRLAGGDEKKDEELRAKAEALLKTAPARMTSWLRDGGSLVDASVIFELANQADRIAMRKTLK
jgi:hypothetical protein